MALSENLERMEPWLFRSPSSDSWIYEAFSRETETLTDNNTYSDQLSSFPELDLVVSSTALPPTASNVLGSDAEISTPKRRKNAVPVSGGKLSKRKSRASKRSHSQTTFIAADLENFRQMVHQMTGVRFGNAQMQILDPEPQRPWSRMSGAGGYLSTLDTSSFLLDHHPQQNVTMRMDSTGSGTDPRGESGGLDFETFSSFPTLESGKVM